MVTCSQVVDGGRWKGEILAEQAMKSARPLVYDVETGSLRFSKSSAQLNSRPVKSPNANVFTPGDDLQRIGGGDDDDDIPADQHKPHILGKLHCGGGSGESSPTCVIQNSALRSNSSSPTMSTISKASSDPGRKSHDLEGTRSYTKTSTTAVSSPEYDEELYVVAGASRQSEPQKIGDGRGRKKQGNNTNGRPGLKGRMENDSSFAKENGWAISHEDQMKEAQTPPFKSIQCAVADKFTSGQAAGGKQQRRLGHGGIPSRPSAQSASILHKSPGIFSFNATYMSTRADSESDEFDQQADTTARELLDRSSRRSFLTPLLKPTPSKWDDAEKWLPGSESLNPARAKARSGPLLAQMVASQAGMSIAWKGHMFNQTVRDNVEEPVVVKSELPSSNPNNPTLVIDFTADEKQQLNLLLGRYSDQDHQGDDGRFSPSCLTGSFMHLGNSGRMDMPSAKSSPVTRDMGTAMTPIPSLDPSRIGTPVRTTSTTTSPPPEKHTPEESPNMRKEETSLADNNDTKQHESPRTLSEKEFQEKTRQEIVTLGTQLGKAKIAAAWAARESAKDSTIIIKKSSKTTLDLETIRREVFASRADAWNEAQKAKYTSRFQHEESKIKAWEEHETAKAEAEMRRVEAKVERMKAQAQEKLASKVAAARRQAEQLREAAEARRSDAAAKAARKAELMKTQQAHGKLTNLLFLSFLCT